MGIQVQGNVQPVSVDVKLVLEQQQTNAQVVWVDCSILISLVIQLAQLELIRIHLITTVILAINIVRVVQMEVWNV